MQCCLQHKTAAIACKACMNLLLQSDHRTWGFHKIPMGHNCSGFQSAACICDSPHTVTCLTLLLHQVSQAVQTPGMQHNYMQHLLQDAASNVHLLHKGDTYLGHATTCGTQLGAIWCCAHSANDCYGGGRAAVTIPQPGGCYNWLALQVCNGCASPAPTHQLVQLTQALRPVCFSASKSGNSAGPLTASNGMRPN